MNLRGPKVRLARQLGIALTPKAARIMEQRPHLQRGNPGPDGLNEFYPFRLLQQAGRPGWCA